jgi:hypothetical protein
MSRTLVALNEGLIVTTPIATTRPTGAGDGVSITGWLSNGIFSPPLAGMFISGSGVLTLDSPTGGTRGAELYGWRLSKWWLIGYLNDGTAIGIGGAGLGYAQEVNILGIFTRLAVAASVSAGTAQAQFAPIDHWGGP